MTEVKLGRVRFKPRMGDLGGLTSQLTSSFFGREVKLGVPCLNAACTVSLNLLSVARNPDKPTQNKLKTKIHAESFSDNLLFHSSAMK